MKNYCLIVGLNDKDTKRQEITTDEARALLAGIVLDYSDGATFTECAGIYKHADGSIVIEKSIKIEIAGITKENALHIAERAKIALNQEAIYFSEYRARVRFI